MEITLDNLEDGGVVQLLAEHLADMHATSPVESVHALDIEGLKQADISFWCAKKDNEVLGCVALKALNAKHAEIKSMRTADHARNSGVASALLAHIIEVAKTRQYDTLYLETGSMDFFKPARRLYEQFGFGYCEPFADYRPDPNSCFMSLKIAVKA